MTKATDKTERPKDKPRTWQVELTLADELLGTSPANPNIYREFIASRREGGVDEAEVAAATTVEEEVQKGTTVFTRDADGKPCLWDYQIKGFFKDACGMLARANGTASSKLKAYKKCIDGLLFVEPRMIPIVLPLASGIGECVRPLRAQTAQGERISLARSETVPAGSIIRFEVQCLTNAVTDCVEEWLDYGRLRGLGQWRNSGKGRFSYRFVE